MKKLVLLTLIGAGLVAFVGFDVVRSAVSHARDNVREALTADLPLREQLAQAQAQIDTYAESIIRGEVAAENLEDMIGDVRREVRGLEVRVERERDALVALRRDLDVVPVSDGLPREDQEARRRAHAFRAHMELLDRRRDDLARLEGEHRATVASLDEARSEQARLAEDVVVLAAEIESLEARTAAARTREAVGDASISRSGFDDAHQRLHAIRTEIRQRNKLLQYYEVERRPVTTTRAVDLAPPIDARTAIDEALAIYDVE